MASVISADESDRLTIPQSKDKKKGFELEGFAIGENKFLAKASMDQLIAIGLWRPSTLATKQAKEDAKAGNTQKVLEASELRKHLNRAFNKKRKDNARDYKDYLKEIDEGERIGDYPPINLLVSSKRNVTLTGTSIIIPYDAVLAAFDGETQTEARFLWLKEDPNSGEVEFPVILHYGVSEEVARQYLHDFNSKGFRIPQSVLSAWNEGGAVTTVIKDALEQSGVDVSKIGTGQKSGKKFIATYTQCRAFVIGFVAGQAALTKSAASLIAQYNAKPKVAHMAAATQELAAILREVAEGEQSIQMASIHIWQCAGIKKGEDIDYQLRWKRAAKSLAATHRPKGQPQVKMTDKLSRIYASI